jgi:hypothetical protein
MGNLWDLNRPSDPDVASYVPDVTFSGYGFVPLLPCVERERPPLCGKNSLLGAWRFRRVIRYFLANLQLTDSCIARSDRDYFAITNWAWIRRPFRRSARVTAWEPENPGCYTGQSRKGMTELKSVNSRMNLLIRVAKWALSQEGWLWPTPCCLPVHAEHVCFELSPNLVHHDVPAFGEAQKQSSSTQLQTRCRRVGGADS